MGNEYLAVLKATYDYEPQSEDEIAIKENQLLFLLDKSDDDWWKIRVKTDSQDDEGPTGLVPSAYVEPASRTSIVKALYDYDANATGELTIKEDEVLHVFDKEDEWLLVQQQKAGGKAGFVPANYVGEDDGASVAPAAVSQIVIPDSPPRPAYKDPETLVASNKGVADQIQTWAVTEIDKKGKKKKGTLGVGNGAVFFASETDKTPVRQWKMGDVDSFKVDKGKHILLEIGGLTPASLHFSAGSKDTAEEIHTKLTSSRALAAPSRDTASPAPDAEAADGKKKNGASVHFSRAEPTYFPPRPASMDEDAESINEHPHAAAAAPHAGGGEQAVAMYDFVADGEDELSVAEGERLTVLEKDGDDWWKVRNARGQEGVVPASYVDPVGGTGGAPAPAARVDTDSDDDDDGGVAAREAEERARREREEAEERARADRERARKEKERERAERDARKREEEERALADAERERERDRKRKEKEQRRAAQAAEDEAEEKRRSIEAKRAEEDKKKRESKNSSKRGPPPEHTRVWHDKTGQFRVEAALLGFNDGKLKLHKVNGVIIEVPSEKMSQEDMDYVKKMHSKKSSPTSSTPTASTSRPSDDDNVPLAVRRKSLAPQKKGPTTDWFDFFLTAGCDVDDCSRYAQSFERDKIDETILPDITESTMRSLGLREGDIIRVKKAIEQRQPKKEPVKDDTSDQIRRDEELARKLQDGDGGAKGRTTSPAPNLFAAPDGTLKDNTKRRGRPQPSKSLPPQNVDLIALNTTGGSDSGRTSTPLVASPTGGAAPSPVQAPPRAASAAPAAGSGFDDDAWTNRPSSTKPVTPSPAAVAPRAPSAPPAPAVAAPPPQTTPSISAPVQMQPTGLAQTTESQVFDQLARLSALRTQSPAIMPPRSAPPSALSPPPASFRAGMGMSISPLPIGQHLQAQQTGMYQPQQQQQMNGPRGPYAPVPANQTLLQPLVPTTTGFNNFVPTRPGSTASPYQQQPPQPPLQFMQQQQQQQQQQPTGFNPGQPMMGQPTGFSAGQSMMGQPTGFGGSLMAQPTGFQQSGPLMSQPTGMPGGGFGGGPMSGPLMSQPTGFAGGPMFNQNGGNFGAQTNPTGFNPGFGQFNGSMATPPPSANKDVTPANIFAQMKSGTFGSDNQPQSAETYDALRPQPTGWGYQQGANGYQNGFSGYQR